LVEAQGQLMDAVDRFVAACAQVPKTLWAEPLAVDQWSPAEVIEHVALSNALITAVFDTIEVKPLTETRTRSLVDDEIAFLFYGGGDEPPGVAEPTGQWVDPADASERLQRSARMLCERSSQVPIDLRCVGARHPVFGTMDGVQWLLFAFAHTERHRADIRRLLKRLATV
jgi:hypothetical protein